MVFGASVLFLVLFNFFAISLLEDMGEEDLRNVDSFNQKGTETHDMSIIPELGIIAIVNIIGFTIGAKSLFTIS